MNCHACCLIPFSCCPTVNSSQPKHAAQGLLSVLFLTVSQAVSRSGLQKDEEVADHLTAAERSAIVSGRRVDTAIVRVAQSTYNLTRLQQTLHLSITTLSNGKLQVQRLSFACNHPKLNNHN